MRPPDRPTATVDADGAVDPEATVDSHLPGDADLAVDPDLLVRMRGRLSATGSARLGQVAAALRDDPAAPVGGRALLRLATELRSELAGAGPLDRLLTDPRTTDVLVNGPEQVWVDFGGGLLRASVRFADDAAVRRLAQRLAARAGRRLDDSQPWVDVRLPGGVRLHAVLPPVSVRGTCLSLRVVRPRGYGLEELVAAGTVTPVARGLLHEIVVGRLNLLISGGTGSGKTTLLAALLAAVDPAERLVIVEDAVELQPDHPHVVNLEGRPANVEGAGAVTLRDLVRQALRMRPDRLVVGEVRGAEVVDLLAALNTGHDGGASTVHANCAADVPARFEALAALGGLPRSAVHAQLAAAVQCVLHLRRSGSARQLAEIHVLSLVDSVVHPLAVWTLDGRPTPGAPVLRRLLVERGRAPEAVP